jgi:hypothetical protein
LAPFLPARFVVEVLGTGLVRGADMASRCDLDVAADDRERRRLLDRPDPNGPSSRRRAPQTAQRTTVWIG